MFRLNHDLLIIDVETTGSDPQVSSIIQLGAVILNRKGQLEGEEFDSYVLPYTREWKEEAYKIHKLSKAFLEKNGSRIDTVLNDFESWASRLGFRDIKKNYHLAQWGNGFDTSCLKMAYYHTVKDYPFHYRAWDVASIIRFYLAQRNLLERKCGVKECATLLGIEIDNSRLHDALYDAKLTGLMLSKIIREGINE